MQRSASPHTQFFTSLKHLEKRLKLENHPSPNPPPPPPPPHRKIINTTQQTDSLGTPIYLNYYNESTANTNASNLSNLQGSEAPQEFLSKSPDFLLQENQAEIPEAVRQDERLDLDDDIDLLMQLLRLSESDEITERGGVNDDVGFYGKIVGVKGPKSGKEEERLEGWIKHYLGSGEKKEPLRLALLLLGKAAFVHSGDGCDGFGGFEFPSTIHEFLQNDPPID